MKVNAKKIIILVAMVLLLVATGCLNYFLGQKTVSPNAPGEPAASLNFFEAYRLDREVSRSQQIMYLSQIIASEVSSTDAVKSAETQRLDLVSLMEKELVLEGLIKSRGFDDCVITMGNNNANVVVMHAEMNEALATQIISLVVKQTGIDADNILILPYV